MGFYDVREGLCCLELQRSFHHQSTRRFGHFCIVIKVVTHQADIKELVVRKADCVVDCMLLEKDLCVSMGT